jgi:peptide deformylase
MDRRGANVSPTVARQETRANLRMHAPASQQLLVQSRADVALSHRGRRAADSARATHGAADTRGRLMPRPILKYGADILHEPSRDVDTITPEVLALLDDMVATMYAAPGIGLAAPQIGVPLRMFVIDLSVGRDPAALIAMINPRFLERDGLQLEDEGCLSVPGFNAMVPRPARAVITGLDRHGRQQQLEGTGLLARAFQHEMDHLDGRFFLDRLRGIRRALIVRKIRKLSQQGKW